MDESRFAHTRGPQKREELARFVRDRLFEGGLQQTSFALTTDQLSQTRSAFFRHFFAPLQQILDDGVRAGELRSIDSAFATQALLNLIDPWTTREARPGGRTAEQLAGDIVDLVVDGIGV